MHAVEREVLKAIGGKTPRKKFSDRSDYLRSLVNDLMKLSDDDFNSLSDEAAEWTNSAVSAINAKEEIVPDFDEVKASEEADVDPEDDEAEDEPDDAEDEETEDDDEADEDEETSDDDEDGSSTDSEDEPDEDAPEVKPAKKKAAPANKAKAKEKPPAKTKVEAKKPPKAKAKSLDDEEDVIVDKWGCMEGSKNSQALAMFEKGATTKEVKETIGGTYYNILGKMVKDGHTVVKEGSLIKITHSADKAKAKPKKK